MSAYIIYHYNIIDKSRVNELGPLSLPIVEKFNGELMVGSEVDVLEGSSYTHMVVYKFESMQKAKLFYNSKENKELSKIRNEIIEGIVLLVPKY